MFFGKNSSFTLRKLVSHFLSNWMEYDRGDSFLFNFEPNGIPFGLKLKRKLSPRSYPIQCERKWKYSFLSAKEKKHSKGPSTLWKLYFLYLSYWMGYDRGDSFLFNFEPNGNPFGSENHKENCHHDHIPINMKGNGNIVFSV